MNRETAAFVLVCIYLSFFVLMTLRWRKNLPVWTKWLNAGFLTFLSMVIGYLVGSPVHHCDDALILMEAAKSGQ